jgi:hypothetical protein
VCSKVSELPRSELGTVVSDYVIGDAKPVHDLLDEFHNFGNYYGGSRLCFDPFGELVHHYEDASESSFCFLNWTFTTTNQGVGI